jgi:hypothetical protein
MPSRMSSGGSELEQQHSVGTGVVVGWWPVVAVTRWAMVSPASALVMAPVVAG